MGLFVVISVGCAALNPFHRDTETVKVGPGEWHSLVVYFKVGVTDEQVNSFMDNILSEPRSDGRGEDFKQGIGEYIGLSPGQAHGHQGFAITFYKNTSPEQRSRIIESIKSNPLVYKVFENVAPNDIKESDL
jgi:hypothetical protein